MQREVYFPPSANRPYPYVRDVIDYANDGSKGHLVFDGYWYRRDEHTLPREALFHTKLAAREPYKEELDPSGDRVEYYELTELQTFRIQITAHEEICDTSEYWDDEEEGGQICLFPTAKQRIEFTVIELVDSAASDVRTVHHGTITVFARGVGITGTDAVDISESEVINLDESE